MNAKERIATILSGGIPDRIGIQESFWAETADLWHEQGHLSPGETPEDYFEIEFGKISPDTTLQLEQRTVEETEEYVVYFDSNGVKRKDFKRQSGYTPQWLEHPVKTRQEWEECKINLTIDRSRLPLDIEKLYRENRKKGRYVVLSMREPYECTWPILGQAELWIKMIEEPEFVMDMFETYGDFIIYIIQLAMTEGYDFDGIWLNGDLGYKNATFFSPDLYRKMLWPVHKRIIDFIKSSKMSVILHSCGRISPLIEDFIEAGFDAVQPLEAKAGLDIREIKKEFGNRITFIGNIDIRKLSGSKEDIRGEIEAKVPAAKQGGGYIFHSDHSIPPTVKFENYEYAVGLAKQLGKY